MFMLSKDIRTSPIKKMFDLFADLFSVTSIDSYT